MKQTQHKHNWHTNKSASAGVLATKLSCAEIKALTETIIREQTLKACEKSQPLSLLSQKNQQVYKPFIKETKNSAQLKTFVDANQNI